ncbi:ATP-binding protein [Pseudodesulfovibrio pelocollis]|uniref:ATP-binding protein n=1 Tax=Pseudodesulfovibrio pelocollis TaxID=3051432 RepID=UPI00255B2260|nr:ATP-binding protein [Pseudodesulfovibrio sp. SB368]
MTDNLRRQAEELARKDDSADKGPRTLEEMQQSLHELRVHQIELELQNEELRRAQAELEALRSRYFDLYDLAPVGYCTVSEKGLTLGANLTAATLLGMVRSEMVGQPWTRFIHKEDQDIYYRHRKELFNTNSATATASCELRLAKKDGTDFWANLTGTIACDAEEAPVCRIVMHDISERKQEEQFRETVERIIHHDIKGPLVNLFSVAQLVLDGESNTSVMESFPQIMLGIRQVIHLIDATEPLLEMEKGAYTPPETPIDIFQILSLVNKSLEKLSTQNKVTVELPSATSCSSREPYLCGEAFLIEDLLMNLVKNAIEASPREGRVTITCQAEPGTVSIAIHNAGAVPEAIRERFFEKYATMGKHCGTGLGTYSAQLIAKAHGGHVGLTTSETEGTTITVALPRCDIK